jgi:hypothetical protein
VFDKKYIIIAVLSKKSAFPGILSKNNGIMIDPFYYATRKAARLVSLIIWWLLR